MFRSGLLPASPASAPTGIVPSLGASRPEHSLELMGTAQEEEKETSSTVESKG